MHYYFENYGLGETDAHLHAGNWRILLLLNQTITYSFLIAGHMKFGPDRCFGLIKKVFKVTHISSIYEFAQLVDNSSSVGINKAQLVATHNGRVIVPVYDWASFLGRYFKKILNIKSFHHFRFSKKKTENGLLQRTCECPGTVVHASEKCSLRATCISSSMN